MKNLLLITLLACSFSLSAQKVIKIGVGGGGSMSDAEVLAALNANANVNILTDSEYTFFDGLQGQIDGKAALSNPYFVTPIRIEDGIADDDAVAMGQLIAANVSYDPDVVGDTSDDNVQTKLQNLELADRNVIRKRSGSLDVSEIYINTTANINGASLPSTVLALPTDPIPMKVITGTVIDLTGYTGINDTSVDTATFTLSTDKRAGAYAGVLINEATEPTITGATQIPGSADFVANKKSRINVAVEPDGTVSYSFTQLEP